MRLIDRLRALRGGHTPPGEGDLPDPAQPPSSRGQWEQAALTNVEITELVKRQLGSSARPWQK